jgi:peptide/nickel transport system substrate-binding protein
MRHGSKRGSFIRAFVAPAALTLLAGGCGDGGEGERSLQGFPPFCQEVLPRVDAWLAGHEHPSGERYGGTAVTGAIGQLAGGMNGLVSADHWAHQHMAFMNLMTLLRLDEDLELRPYLARDWEVSPDGTEIIFHLRDDVRWHDGEPTTAHDVAFTYVRATDPETGFPNAGYWQHYVQGPEGVEVLDDHTIRVRLRPHAEVLDPWRALPIMPRHLLADVPASELRQHPFGTRCPVGNGPFVFEEHRQGAQWSFVRNPAFPAELGGPAYLDRYVFRIIPEPTTLLAELLTESLDVYYSPNPDQLARIEDAGHLDFIRSDFRAYTFVIWNTRRPQLADARVRRAITMATDRKGIMDALLRGYGRVAQAGVPPFHWAYHEGLDGALPHDPDGARRLLDEAGWVDSDGDGIRRDERGIPLEISILYGTGQQQRQEIAEIMQAQLGPVGIRVRPRSLEWGAVVDQLLNDDLRDYDGVVMGYVVDFRVDDHDLFHSSKLKGPFHWTGVRHDRLDALLDTLQLVMDRDDATPLWHEYQELLVELQPFTYFWFPQRLIGLNRRVQGVEMDARGELVAITRWWIPADQRVRGR